MATPTIYRWDDAGAPLLAGGTDYTKSLGAVLEACLVTGYGSKAAAGWSKQFDNAAGKKVFRPASLEFGLQVDDTQNTTITTLNCADAWVDASTPQAPGVWVGCPRYFCRSNITTTTAHRAWVVIASPNYCLVFNSYGSSSWLVNGSNYSGSTMACGKYTPFLSGMALTNLLLGYSTASAATVPAVFNTYNAHSTNTTTGHQAVLQRSPDGGITSEGSRAVVVAMGHSIPAGPGGYTSARSNSGRTGAEAVPGTRGVMPHVPYWLFNYLGDSVGVLPGVRAILAYLPNSVNTGGGFTPLTLADKTYLLLLTHSSSTPTTEQFLLLDVYGNDWP